MPLCQLEPPPLFLDISLGPNLDVTTFDAVGNINAPPIPAPADSLANAPLKSTPP